METTFMTIHNLCPNANILFASASIVNILGYQPHEVTGRSCFDYFHPDEVPFARHQHGRGIQLDKAASLHYVRIMGKDGQWVSCEIVFTVVYGVLVACTSIYRQGSQSYERNKRAREVRRIFSSSPRDPRYHMLEHLSAKFRTTPQAALHEPRAALILNRFTRTLPVMYATDAVSAILGVTADEVTGKSFYECMQENCLHDAIRCLERAKENDSIAYMRFLYRDPRRLEDLEEVESEASHSSDLEEGDPPFGAASDEASVLEEMNAPLAEQYNLSLQPIHTGSHADSGININIYQDPERLALDPGYLAHAPSSLSSVQPMRGLRESESGRSLPAPPIEVEAVISCTSDGLVVIIRRARPMIPIIQQPPILQEYHNGLFAAPWAFNPIMPTPHVTLTIGGPPINDFMDAIRDVAAFAWSLTGINGTIAEYSHGIPRGEAVPPAGFPIWDSQAQITNDSGPENQAAAKWAAQEKQSRGSRGSTENQEP